MKALALIIITSMSLTQIDTQVAFTYHNYEAYTLLLKYYNSQFPNQTYLYSIGQSVQGIHLFYLFAYYNHILTIFVTIL